jgi:hypothetical protein
MKHLTLTLFFLLQISTGYACDEKNNEKPDNSCGVVTITLDSDLQYCDGNPLFLLKLAESFSGYKLTSLILAIEKDLKVEYLANLEVTSEGESYFCIPSKMVQYATISAGYGKDMCMGTKHRFGITDLSKLKVSEPFNLELSW